MTDETKDDFAVQDDAEMNEIHEFDFQRAVGLMMIAEKVATVAPKCTSLLGIAQAELEQMNQQARDIARRRADRAREADERKRAAEQERIDQENTAEAAKAEDEHRDPVIQPEPEPVQQPGQPAPERRV